MQDLRQFLEPGPQVSESFDEVHGGEAFFLPLPIVDQLPARHVRAAWQHRCAIGCVEHGPPTSSQDLHSSEEG